MSKVFSVLCGATARPWPSRPPSGRARPAPGRAAAASARLSRRERSSSSGPRSRRVTASLRPGGALIMVHVTAAARGYSASGCYAVPPGPAAAGGGCSGCMYHDPSPLRRFTGIVCRTWQAPGQAGARRRRAGSRDDSSNTPHLYHFVCAFRLGPGPLRLLRASRHHHFW